MHKTDEHTNSNGQRYPIPIHAPAGVGDRENRENQNEREDELHHKRLRSGDVIRGCCDS